MNPRVSIVLPCYNGAKMLGGAIESVIAQTYQEWELIIVNDCSTDNTLEVAQSYADKDQRIRVFSNEKNSKLPATLNHGFREARGEFWTWTSDDNLLLPTMLEEFVKYFDAHPEVGFLVSDEHRIDMDGNVLYTRRLSDDLQMRLTVDNQIGASFMYRAAIAKKIGPYREDLFLVEDYEYFLRLRDNTRVERIPQVLYQYRDNPGSLSATRRRDVRRRLCEFRLEYLPQAERNLKDNHTLLASYYYRIVDYLEGKEKWKYYWKFAFKLPVSFGLKYIFVHLPKRKYYSIKYNWNYNA